MTSHIRPAVSQTDPLRSPKNTLPTMYDLPSEDPQEPGLPDEFHDLQPQLLSRTLRLAHYDRSNCFIASDLNLYYDVNHPLWYKRPDWFLALDVPRLYEGRELRRSYVVWQEGRAPEVVVEFLSPGTEAEDLGRFYDDTQILADLPTEKGNSIEQESPEAIATAENPPSKFAVYERLLRVSHYIVYSRYSQRLRYFRLEGGFYREQPLNSQPPLIWLTELEIGLGIWQGEFEGVPGNWLRWCDAAGEWQLTDTEQSQLAEEQERLAKEQAQLAEEQERLAKEQAQLAEEQMQAQLKQAARKLLETGMSVEQVVSLLGLSEAQVRWLQFDQRD